MPKPQEYTDTFILTKKVFFSWPQSMSTPVEKPCHFPLIAEQSILAEFMLLEQQT